MSVDAEQDRQATQHERWGPRGQDVLADVTERGEKMRAGMRSLERANDPGHRQAIREGLRAGHSEHRVYNQLGAELRGVDDAIEADVFNSTVMGQEEQIAALNLVARTPNEEFHPGEKLPRGGVAAPERGRTQGELNRRTRHERLLGRQFHELKDALGGEIEQVTDYQYVAPSDQLSVGVDMKWRGAPIEIRMSPPAMMTGEDGHFVGDPDYTFELVDGQWAVTDFRGNQNDGEPNVSYWKGATATIGAQGDAGADFPTGRQFPPEIHGTYADRHVSVTSSPLDNSGMPSLHFAIGEHEFGTYVGQHFWGTPRTAEDARNRQHQAQNSAVAAAKARKAIKGN